jgi:hypothetical protein
MNKKIEKRKNLRGFAAVMHSFGRFPLKKKKFAFRCEVKKAIHFNYFKTNLLACLVLIT